MNISIDEIAGYMSERHVWQLISELSTILSGDTTMHHITAKHIVWDEQHFSVADTTEHEEDAYKFLSPEASAGEACAASSVWSLGAVAFYMHMGCHVFNGWGGASQTAGSPVPFMRKELKELSQTLQQCLSFDPQKRPTMEQLCQTSKAQLKRLQVENKPRERKPSSPDFSPRLSIDDFWPEEMVER